MTAPSRQAREAIDRGIGTVERRVEVYEADGTTPWNKSAGDRLLGGGVNLTYGDNERRSLDLTLDNSDGAFRSNPNGFWYDKIVKVYRGVSWRGTDIGMVGAVIRAPSSSSTEGFRFAGYLKRFDIDAIYDPSMTSAAAFDMFDIVFVFSAHEAMSSTLVQLCKELYQAGKHIVTISSRNTGAEVPHITTGTVVTENWGIDPNGVTGPLTAGWSAEDTVVSRAGAPVTSLAVGAVPIARWLMDSASYSITASVASHQNGAKWFDLHLPQVTGNQNGTYIANLIRNVINYMRGTGQVTWETQIGEFAIDNIAEDSYPSSLKITGRDYVKKCMNSKLENAVSFAVGTSIKQIITSLAANAGIVKMKIDASMNYLVLTSELSFDRGTPRWDVMRQAANTYNYEIFFDAEGVLITRVFRDPTLSPIDEIFQTGVFGNLEKLNRVTNDSRIYNQIVVYGDPPSGELRMPFVAQALNANLNSPTRWQRIGKRYYSYASTFFTTQQQCQDYANRLLKVHALESYELSFGAINYPWTEVGNIVEVIDPDAQPGDPDRYLMDSATIPLDLGPMSATGKRVTIVG